MAARPDGLPRLPSFLVCKAEFPVRSYTMLKRRALPALDILRSFDLHVHTGGPDYVDHFLRKFVEIRLPSLLRCRQIPNDLSLTLTGDFAIAEERRQDLLMPEVLAPRLVFFSSFADLLAESGECVSEAVRRGICGKKTWQS
jgi:hypothetical protein